MARRFHYSITSSTRASIDGGIVSPIVSDQSRPRVRFT